jgi:type II secretory pathway pseudopilin PulG|tara:strand:- start:14 stop:1054 length:1041 start_codon:yes stop_codon:yes gene_type:complete
MADNEATHEVDATEKNIREGYVEEPQEEKAEEVLSERERVMNEIVDLREQEEMGEELEATEEVEQEQEEVEVVGDAPIWNESGKWFTKIKVDGEEVSVPFDDLKSSHQKDKASQKRFEDAAAYGRQIQAREEQLNAYVGQLKQQQAARQQPPPTQEAAQEGQDDQDLVKEYHDALYQDDAAKATQLFKTLTDRGRREPATQNVEEVVNQVLGRAMAQRQAEQERQQRWAYNKSLEDAIHEFQEGYPDIAGVPELRAIADNQTVILMEEHPEWTPSQIIKESAEYTRKWVGDNTKITRDNTRAVRKQKIVKQPKAASATSIMPDEESFPTNPTDIIQEMKQQRGQVL